MYPQLSSAAEIFLCAPISTATVERDFSAMNRILTDLRNRLTTQHLEQLMRISIEGPLDLDNSLKDLIVGRVKNYGEFQFDLNLFFLQVLFF